MPWTIANPPPPARNKGRADKARCVAAANAVLRDGDWESLGEDARKELEAEAIAACLGAMNRRTAPRERFARGEGQGVGGPRQGIGGPDTCECPKCGHKVPHEAGVPCADMECPECGAKLKPGGSAVDEQASERFYVAIEKGFGNALIFPFGKFFRNGVWREFTPKHAEEMVRNFEANVLERDVPVNREHDRPSGRIGKVTRLWIGDEGVCGEIDVDDEAKQKFLYVSPELPPKWEWTHPRTGKVYKNVLAGLALTNYPFFGGRMNVWSDGEWETYTNDNFVSLSNILSDSSGEFTITITYRDEEVVLPHDAAALSEAYGATRDAFVHEVPIVRLDEAQRVAYGVVLQPNEPDAQGHVMSAVEIEATCHRYMEGVQSLDVHHDRIASNDEVKLVECWIQREPVTWQYGERETEVLPGSWCAGVKFYSDELWQQVLDGEITGFSPRGWGRLSRVANS